MLWKSAQKAIRKRRHLKRAADLAVYCSKLKKQIAKFEKVVNKAHPADPKTGG
jgi:hypothetical protein